MRDSTPLTSRRGRYHRRRTRPLVRDHDQVHTGRTRTGQGGSVMANSTTVLQDVGPNAKTLAVLGDGFAAGADQTIYNNYVRDEVMRGVFLSHAFNEDISAWNSIRVNLESNISGASTRTWNLMGTPNDLSDDTFTENIVDTALDIISNGEWWHGWFEDGDDTACNILIARAVYAPK